MTTRTAKTLTIVSSQYGMEMARRCRWLAINVTEDEVEAGEDRDDVGHVHALQQPRQDRDVVERRRADLAAERSEAALADEVVPHLAERVLGVDPRLTCGHLDDARHLGLDRTGGQPVEELVDDLRRLPHFLQPDPVP